MQPTGYHGGPADPPDHAAQIFPLILGSKPEKSIAITKESPLPHLATGIRPSRQHLALIADRIAPDSVLLRCIDSSPHEGLSRRHADCSPCAPGVDLLLPYARRHGVGSRGGTAFSSDSGPSPGSSSPPYFFTKSPSGPGSLKSSAPRWSPSPKTSACRCFWSASRSAHFSKARRALARRWQSRPPCWSAWASTRSTPLACASSPTPLPWPSALWAFPSSSPGRSPASMRSKSERWPGANCPSFRFLSPPGSSSSWTAGRRR